jgi:hypothetical protein
VNFAAINLCVASQRVFIVVSIYLVIDSVRKLLDTSSYVVCVRQWTMSNINSVLRSSHCHKTSETQKSRSLSSSDTCAVFMIKIIV